MERPKLKGKAQTVLGLVNGDQLGFTLPHEHFLIDCTVDFTEPSKPRDRELARQPVSFENLSWVRSHRFSSLDNLCLDDEQMAISEAMLFKEAGGKTIAEVTPNNAARDPAALRRLAQATGINVIMGTAYYIDESYTPELRRRMDSWTEEDIADEFVRDITIGVDGTGICAGIIGEVGCSWPLTDNERKVLRAAAIAQQRTGAPITVHPGAYDEAPLEIVKVLAEAGADPSRVIIDHMERTIKSHSARFRLAETGCYLEWDRFGSDGEYPIVPPFTENKLPDYPSDAERLNQIIQLIGEGHLNQILISHDVWIKIELTHFGGQGYAHILNNVIPLMRQKSIPEEYIRTITVENPKRALTFT
jgi:phosphotriesterase-related protein